MKVVLVTGGTSGFGEAAAAEMARRGWRVAAMARTSRENVFQGDVGNDADCRRVAKAVLDKWGRIDALVNSAGTTKFVAHTDLEGLSADDWQHIFRVNVVGAFQMIRACAAALKEARGCVVNVSSISSRLGTGSSIAYAASKAALDTMTASLARALGPEIRVNNVNPGYVRTPWQVAAHGEEGARRLEEKYAAVAPLKAAPVARDVADAIAWLIEGARATTGEILYVDGGLHVASPR
ncbi:MAG TPA: SDR family oxidoreductase [Burkholderiales bacterium]|nr:SDR family oxidoreductase [Burkholderiales bacterium]